MKLLSFGEIVWDLFGEEQHLGGAPLNFAAFASMLGFESGIISSVGDDKLGQKSIEQLKRLGVNTKYISVLPNKETGKCLVELNENAVPTYIILDDVAYDYIAVPENKENVDIRIKKKCLV